MGHLQHQRHHLALIFIAVAAATIGAGERTSVAPTGPKPGMETLPVRAGSARFAVVGDTGTGGSAQVRVAEQLAAARTRFPFDFVIMVGDNLYGSERPRDYEKKFTRPYRPLLDAGVKFYAALGNHDDTNQIYYKPFNMDAKRYYTFKPKANLRFFALDSNYMDPEQLEWLVKELRGSGSDWKICFFHHPLYSSGGRHGSDLRLRQQLEPLFVKHSVDAVFTGHEHFYERLKPQRGIHYFISGGSARLRKGDIEEGSIHAAGFDTGYSFMLVEIADRVLHFQVISDAGRTVDAGSVSRAPDRPRTTARYRGAGASPSPSSIF